MNASPGDDQTISVVLVDDHPLMCAGVRRALERDDAIEVVGEAHTGVDAIQVVCELEPDVVLVDYRLPDMDGTSLVSQVRETSCHARFVMLTCFADEHAIRSAVDVGVAGFLTKGTADAGALIEAVKNAAAGLSTISPDALARLVTSVRNDGSAQHPRLTEREFEVWRLLGEGLTNAEVAEHLVLSERTVKFHVSNVLRKTGARTRAEATAKAYQSGVMDRLD